MVLTIWLPIDLQLAIKHKYNNVVAGLIETKIIKILIR